MKKKSNWIYFDTKERYSVLDEEHREYDRYERSATYKVAMNGENLTEVSGSTGYLGSSD